MATDRRDFFHSLLNGALGGGIASLGSAAWSADTSGARPSKPAAFHPAVFDFWNSKVRSPYDEYVSNTQSKGVIVPDAADSTFLLPSESKGLGPAALLSPDDIPSFPKDGNVSVSVHVERFRPSPADKATLASLQTGTLRIDVKQVTPLPGLPEALAWTAMATLASRTKGQTIPTLDNVKFDPGSIWGQFQTIPLTDGLGFWSWNFFMKRREGFWAQLLDQLFKVVDTTAPLLPLLGLPGVAVSGLKYIDNILGGIQSQGDSAWMFRGLDIAVCATRKGFDTAGAKGASKLPLTTGSYVIFPQSKVSQLDSDLVIRDGFLVPPNTPPLKTYDAAAKLLPDVSYMTISVGVNPSPAKTAGRNRSNLVRPHVA